MIQTRTWAAMKPRLAEKAARLLRYNRSRSARQAITFALYCQEVLERADRYRGRLRTYHVEIRGEHIGRYAIASPWPHNSDHDCAASAILEIQERATESSRVNITTSIQEVAYV